MAESSIGSGALDPNRIDIVRPEGDAFLPEYGPNDLFVLERTDLLPMQDQICHVSFRRDDWLSASDSRVGWLGAANGAQSRNASMAGGAGRDA